MLKIVLPEILGILMYIGLLLYNSDLSIKKSDITKNIKIVFGAFLISLSFTILVDLILKIN